MTGTIKKAVLGWGEPQTISDFPFTASADGIVILIDTPPSSSSSSYLYINENGSAHARLYISAGLQGTMTFPVRKGSVYSINISSNVSYNNGIRFYPFA